MRFTCSASDMVAGLSIALRALSPRTTQPILEGVLLRTCDEGVKITCSDGAISIVTVVSAQVLLDGEAVMPGRLFLEVMRKMPEGELTAELNENQSLKLRCMGSRITLAGQSGELYPALPLVSAQNSFVLPQTLLKEMINQTAFAISTDESRMVLTGALLEIERAELRLVALDGFRLSMRTERLGEDAPELSAIIPGKTLSEISKVLSDDEEKTAMILLGNSQMMVNLGQTQFYSTLIEGDYIKYRQILPKEWKTRVRVDRQQLAMCVDRASLMAREGRNNLIKMEVGEGRLVITAQSESGDAYEELAAEIEGEALEIAFNVRYISDVMRVLSDDEIVMQFNSGVSPCVICPVSGDAYYYLVLPVRINA